jgi:hypothetical protein
MFVRCVVLCCVTFLAASLARLEAQGQSSPTNKALAEAVGLHRANRLPEALIKLKAAAAAQPSNKALADYLTDLTPLAQREALSAHALKAGPVQEASIQTLAAYLAKGGKTDADKAFLVFRWVTDRIAYDIEANRANRTVNLDLAFIFAKRKTICAGYARLFDALCQEAGLESVRLLGHVKESGTIPGTKLDALGLHEWNAVKLDGRWALVEPTWAAGGVVPNGSWRKNYKSYWFDVPPELMAYSHFPAEAKWQLTKQPLPPESFEQLPRAIEILRFGFSPQAVQNKAQEKSFRGLPTAFTYAGPRVTFHTAPLDRHLKAGMRYNFKLESLGLQAVYIQDGPKNFPAKGTGTGFEASVTPQKGVLKICGHYHGENANWPFLEYIVE